MNRNEAEEKGESRLVRTHKGTPWALEGRSMGHAMAYIRIQPGFKKEKETHSPVTSINTTL